MTWIDIVLLVLIVVLAVHGMIMGLIRGLFDIAGLIAGYILAISFCGRIHLPQAVSFLIIFLATVIIFSAAGIILTKLIKHTPLSAVNRLLGALLGLVKAFAFGFVFLVILAFFHKGREEYLSSDIAPVIQKYGLIASKSLPVRWYRFIKNILEPEPPKKQAHRSFGSETVALRAPETALKRGNRPVNGTEFNSNDFLRRRC
jgi:membrane protein required for colicin V production